MDRRLEGHMKLESYFSFKVEDLGLKDIVEMLVGWCW